MPICVQAVEKIIHSAQLGKYDELKQLLSEYPDHINEYDIYVRCSKFQLYFLNNIILFFSQERYTPLVWAAKSGQVETTRLLCESGAQIDLPAGWVSSLTYLKIFKAQPLIFSPSRMELPRS